MTPTTSTTPGGRIADSVLAGMVQISADAIIAIDEEQRIIFFNTGAERIFGYEAAEVVGGPLTVLLPERYRAMHQGHVTRFGASHERARRMGERQEISGLRRNGEEFPAEASIAWVEVRGRPVFTVVLRDITERKRIETQLRLALRARDEMAGVVSHDLRNPVQAVKMLARAILAAEGDEAVSPAVAEQAAVILRAGEQMDALIEDLLDATRIEAGQLRVQAEPADAERLVRAAAETLEPLATAKEQTLTVELARALPRVMADAARVVQILSNVVGNAIKFTPRGGRVTVAARPDVLNGGGGSAGAPVPAVLFSVSDDGPGIPAAQLPHVFDRYWQSRRTGRTSGAGLGLPIAKGIVEAHGGRIRVASVEGEGTTVEFTLPAVER